jgi:hypothetical protein
LFLRNKTVTSSVATSSSSVAVNSDDSDYDYNSRESTLSSTSSKDSKDLSTKFYLFHDGGVYDYKLKKDSLRWVANGYDVSNAFFKYRDNAISKAENFSEFNKYE